MQDDGKDVKPSQEILDPQPLPGVNSANHRQPSTG